MADTVEHVLYSPTLGTLDLTASFDTYRYMLYGAQFDIATPATTAAAALIGQSVSFDGMDARDAVSFYVGIKSLATGDGQALSDGCAALERWHRAVDAEYRYKPKNGARNCLPIITDPSRRRGGLKVEATEAPVGGIDVATDEWNQSMRWLKLTLTCHPFVLAENTTSTPVSLTASVGSMEVTGSGDAAATVALSGGQLDKCVVYVAPELTGFSPLCRTHMTTGTTISRSGQPAFYDATAWNPLSGRVVTLDGSVLPSGGYAVVAHLYNSGSATTISVPLTVNVNGANSTAIPSPVVIGATSTVLQGIAGFVLPETSGTVTLTFGTVANTYVDEVFIFPLSPDAALWLFDAGSATTAELAAPVTANEQGSMVPSQSIEVTFPVLTAETMTVIAASAKQASPTVQVSYRPAFLTFVTGEDPTL